MRPVACVLIALAGCGRFWFDPVPAGGMDAPGGTDASDGPICEVLPQPMGYWPMDGDGILDRQVFDVSGNNFHGQIVGDPIAAVVPGRIGQALDFGATQVTYIDVPNLPIATAAGAANTVVLWYFHDAPTVDEVLVYLPPGTAPAPPRYDLWLTAPGGTPLLCLNGGNGDCWGVGDDALLGRWVHVAAVFPNGPTADGFVVIDGVAVTNSCVFGTCDQSRSAMSPVHLGGSDQSYSWHGKLDEVRIYDRALTLAEIQLLYACQ